VVVDICSFCMRTLRDGNISLERGVRPTHNCRLDYGFVRAGKMLLLGAVASPIASGRWEIAGCLRSEASEARALQDAASSGSA
jgi:hypothetical protein